MVGIHPTLAETMTMFPAQRFDELLGRLAVGTGQCVLDQFVFPGCRVKRSRESCAAGKGWSRNYWAKHSGYFRDSVLRGGILKQASQVEPTSNWSSHFALPQC